MNAYIIQHVHPYILLALAILSEVAGTSALRASEGFSRLVPSALVVAGYGVSFYVVSLTLKTLPLGFVYAVWSGLGTVLIVAVGVVVFREGLDVARGIGIALIILGVVVLNAFSGSPAH